MSENKQDNEKQDQKNNASEPVQELEPQVLGGGLDPEFDDDKDVIPSIPHVPMEKYIGGYRCISSRCLDLWNLHQFRYGNTERHTL